jgi:hypothetical protein
MLTNVSSTTMCVGDEHAGDDPWDWGIFHSARLIMFASCPSGAFDEMDPR